MKSTRAAFALLLAFAACGTAPSEGMVNGVLQLPRELREVSGITAIEGDRIACIQDEVGALFVMSLQANGEPQRIAFGAKGDYEGVARVGDGYWVLRSDGMLLELRPEGAGQRIARSVQLPPGFAEWEALCFDHARNELLVAPKSRPEGDKSARDARPLFAVDVASASCREQPLVTLRRSALIEQAEALGLELPIRVTPKGKERVTLELALSEVAVVPGTDELLLLCAGDHLLLRVARDGRLLATRRLDAELMPQAEGLTFLADGRLLVATEAAGGAARLVVVPLP